MLWKRELLTFYWAVPLQFVWRELRTDFHENLALKYFYDVILLKFGPNEKNFVLPGLSFGLDYVIQANTPIKQRCNFSRDSLAFKTNKDM